jgi:hypothetical protein
MEMEEAACLPACPCRNSTTPPGRPAAALCSALLCSSLGGRRAVRSRKLGIG